MKFICSLDKSVVWTSVLLILHILVCWTSRSFDDFQVLAVEVQDLFIQICRYLFKYTCNAVTVVELYTHIYTLYAIRNIKTFYAENILRIDRNFVLV